MTLKDSEQEPMVRDSNPLTLLSICSKYSIPRLQMTFIMWKTYIQNISINNQEMKEITMIIKETLAMRKKKNSNKKIFNKINNKYNKTTRVVMIKNRLNQLLSMCQGLRRTMLFLIMQFLKEIIIISYPTNELACK